MKNTNPIFVFFGQPGSGKSTIARAAKAEIYRQTVRSGPILDGDSLRAIFADKDYSKEGRLKNLNRISDIAVYLSTQNHIVFVSAVYPYLESRIHIEFYHPKVYWFHLYYSGIRGREDYHVDDFYEKPRKNTIKINTSKNDVETIAKKVCSFYREISNLT